MDAESETNGWISVEERLPELLQMGILSLARSGEVAISFRNEYGWQRADTQSQSVPVTHWQPLPAPPTKKPPTTSPFPPSAFVGLPPKGDDRIADDRIAEMQVRVTELEAQVERIRGHWMRCREAGTEQEIIRRHWLHVDDRDGGYPCKERTVEDRAELDKKLKAFRGDHE